MTDAAREPVRVHVPLGARSYEVVIGSHLFASDASPLLGERTHAAAVIVTNTTVEPLLADAVQAWLAPHFASVSRIVLPDGEAHKTWATLDSIFTALLGTRCDRGTTLFALGGGVVGDLTGFAAACYMRGIAFVQLPTTLLAQVDSSVGGKTAINHPAGKNMIGAFHQPRLVVADVSVLRTLPRRELVAGLAEVIKYGAIVDAAFLAWIEAHLDALLGLDEEALIHAVKRSCEIKAEIVAADELETGRRALLNFGHTFGHAIEAGLGFGEWLHGEAVGCGMVMAARLSQRLGLIDAARAERLRALVERAGLPTRLPPLPAKELVALMHSDKKASGGKLRFVVLEGVAGAKVLPVSEALVESVVGEAGA